MTYPISPGVVHQYPGGIRTADILASQAELGSLDDVILGVTELMDAVADYEIAEQYYLGTREEFFASPIYKRKLQETGTTFRLNYASTPVDTVVERLEINEVIGGDDKTRKMLNAIWELNQMDIESTDIHRRACQFGDAPVFVWPSDEEDDADTDNPDPNVGIDIFYNDPRTVRFIYDSENPKKVRFVIKMWISKHVKLKDGQTIEQFRVDLYYRDRIESYITKENGDPKERDSWVKFTKEDNKGNDLPWPMDNPYKRIPWFHFRTDRPYGVPEHKNAYGPQDAITKIVITQMNTMDYHSFPQRWALMGEDLDDDEGDSEDFGIADVVDSDDDSIGVPSGPDRTQMRAEPGHMWFLKNIKSVGEFTAAGSDVFDKPLLNYVRAMAQVTRTPVHRFDSGGNPPSGQSLRIAEQPFIKKVRYRQMSFGATWSDLLSFVVKIIKEDGLEAQINKMIAPDPAPDPNTANPDSEQVDTPEATAPDEVTAPMRVGVSWQNPSAQDDQLTWDIVILKINAGVPHRQALLEAGYSKKQLDDWGVPPSKWTKAPPPAPLPPGTPPPTMVDGQPLPGEDPLKPVLPSIRTNPKETVGKLD